MPMYRAGDVANRSRGGAHARGRRRRLSFDLLEARLAPAQVVLGALMFDGDFTQSASDYSANGDDIQLGYAPLPGQSFEAVYNINGQVEFDTSMPATFQATNATFFTAPFTTSGGTAVGPFDVWTGTETFNVDQLITDGFSLAGAKSFTFEGTTLTIDSIGFGPAPQNGVPYIPTVELRGALAIGQTGLSVAVNGQNYIGISQDGVTLTGFSASVTKKFTLFGVEFEPSNVTLSYDADLKEFSLSGEFQ